ncbi:hypothetical protein KKC63_01505 [Patescibacteria group bacterium]|nr:hypothetical protein [Patescibacteria group bacterium]MBU4023059.1 hypothetical protein [Patescibacteria group bacterium]MBU4078444.1 hypothetical protein [Patescibacteria group bacterium]
MSNIKNYFNKGISAPIAFFVIILLALVVGIVAWCFGQNQNANPATVQTVSPTITPDLTPTTTPAPTITPIVDLSFETFIDGLREVMVPYHEDLKIFEREYIGEHRGFPWINENNDVDLIKGYSFYAAYLVDRPVINNCSDGIITYLEKTLTPNAKNSRNEAKLLAFERDNIKCVFNSFDLDLECGDAAESTTPEYYREIYNFWNPNMETQIDLYIYEVIDDFAVVAGKGYAALLKRTESGWIEITGTQDLWECEVIFEHNVPPSLVDNECFFYDTTREYWGYNEELGKWEKGYESDEDKG